MNFREGMRRLGIVLGFGGLALGLLFGYESALATWRLRTLAQRFDHLALSAGIQKDLHDVKAAAEKDWFASNAPLQERKRLVRVQEDGKDGVKQFMVESSKWSIASIELSTGEVLTGTEKPSLLAYGTMPAYALLGFLVPWGCIRVITWIATGFSHNGLPS